MEQNINQDLSNKNKYLTLFKKNRNKFYLILGILMIIIAAISLFQYNKTKKNNLISEKYITAGLLLASENFKDSLKIYDEIILSKNKFYSTLALNTILEKNLVTDESKILNYFTIVEKLNKLNDQKDLVIFKKALYLNKISRIQESKDLLNNLVESNSKFKEVAKELLEE